VHLEQAAPALPTQRPVLTAAGESGVVYPADPRRRLRVTTFLPGVLRRHAPWQASLAASIGTVAATLDAALQSFAHPGAAQHLLWDLRRAQELRPLLPLLEGDPLAATVLAVLDRHAALLPDLASLPAQPIHNDLNPSNLIVSDDGTHVAGVIDFGDMILAPRVLELAVACAYLTDADDPLQAIAECTHAYAQSLSVSPDELQPLGDLMATRWAMTVLITEWRSRLQPENAAYILRNNAGSRRGLDLYAGDGRARLQQLMKELRR
jgi:Ser/Thr protein kinase RdoA (MazF antagonist)